MAQESNPIDLATLKQLIRSGVEAIPIDRQNKEAIIVIGDTGVGKSTIMSFLSGSELVVKFDGLKPTLDTVKQSQIRIGHDKYSETSIPTKIVIGQMAFYDCPGFKDNKGEQYEISNSFFVQRLLDIYHKVKLVLVVDQSHISEVRADKLPKLVRNLHKAFRTFEDIKDGVLRLVNSKNDESFMFQEEQRQFLEFLVEQKRILLFKQAEKQQKGTIFTGDELQSRILNCIQRCQYVKSKHITNILSENAKLAIRDFIDDITKKSATKIELICKQIFNLYSEKVQIQVLNKDVEAVLVLKKQVLKLAQEIKDSNCEIIMDILQRELPINQLQNFEEDFASVLFFKGIYDKTDSFFSNLINKIDSELFLLLTKMDQRITSIEKQIEEDKRREKERYEQRIREEIRNQEKRQAIESYQKMEQLQIMAKQIGSSKRSLLGEIQNAMNHLYEMQKNLQSVKKEASELLEQNKQIQKQYVNILNSGADG